MRFLWGFFGNFINVLKKKPGEQKEKPCTTCRINVHTEGISMPLRLQYSPNLTTIYQIS
ncbi:hypothetical protein AB205_0065050 [Aquarana catesbeiana]|uniref:Uncharacterized protein n=1 Tax=Aquarana catesbeiana TaxID=8400 RepID=A0A2G9RQB0_AQUCT|nr:hypothetical protein AB205_0065050 [Aquarana catesbeiana]